MQPFVGMDHVKLSDWHLLVAADFPAEIFGRMIRGEYFDHVRGPFERVNASKKARVYRCEVGFSGRPVKLYYKQYLCRSAVDMLKHIFRPSRARRSIHAAALLERHELKAPKAVAMGERKLGPIVLASFTFTEAVTDAPDIYEFCLAFRTGEIGPAKRRLFVEQLGHTIGRMHAAGISHGDLRPGNVLAKKAPGGYEFFFLDNERTQGFRKLPLKLRLKNLMQINMLHAREASACDRMRFWKSYLKQNPAMKPHAKEIARRVVDRTTERLNKKRHESQR